MQVGRPGVDAGQLEQVDHHRVEAAHLSDDDVERLLGAVGEIVSPAVDDLGGGGEGGDRRTQLVADVGGEAGLAFDPRLHGVGHPVERVGEPVEIGIALAGDPGVEVAGGDLPRSVGDAVERSQQAAARPPADAGGQQDRDGGADHEGDEDRAQRPLRAAELERLEVVGVDIGDVHADADVALVAEVEALDAGHADVESLAQLGGEALERDLRPVLAARPSPRVTAAKPSDSVRRVWRKSPKSSVPERNVSRTRTALSTACWRATSERCSSSDERAKAYVTTVSETLATKAITPKNRVTLVRRRIGR